MDCLCATVHRHPGRVRMGALWVLADVQRFDVEQAVDHTRWRSVRIAQADLQVGDISTAMRIELLWEVENLLPSKAREEPKM